MGGSVAITGRAALDRAYDLRARVPAHPAYFAWYDQASAALRARWAERSRLDLAYGPTPRQAIDLYRPTTPDPAPVVVFIHGGYWHSQDRKRYAFLAEPLLARGVAVALLGYDLAPAVDLDAITHQARDGFAWLWRHAGELGLDQARFAVAGHSAGGHLAAMLLATAWPALGLPPAPIAAACPISGIFELEPIRRCYLNDVLYLSQEQVRRLSPIRLPLPAACPVLVVVGGDETGAFLVQSACFVARLRIEGVEVEHRVLRGLDHFGIIKAMAETDAPVVSWLCRHLQAGTETIPPASASK
jgi:arylformamidase